MAKARKCDRCGRFYEKNQKVLEYLGHADLCDSCLDLLCDFLNIAEADIVENEE